METRQMILQCLIDIRDKGPVDSHVGICSNLIHARDNRGPDYAFAFTPSESRVVLKGLWKKWPHYSGHVDYPVCAPAAFETPLLEIDDEAALKKARAHSAYVYIADGWEGEYGASRRQLLSYLIEKLEKVRRR